LLSLLELAHHFLRRIHPHLVSEHCAHPLAVGLGVLDRDGAVIFPVDDDWRSI